MVLSCSGTKSGHKIIKSNILELDTVINYYTNHAIQSEEAIKEIRLT